MGAGFSLIHNPKTYEADPDGYPHKIPTKQVVTDGAVFERNMTDD
jgi:hypothetical protein